MKIANGREQLARIFLKVLVQIIREIKYKSITLRKYFEHYSQTCLNFRTPFGILKYTSIFYIHPLFERKRQIKTIS